jgi:tyrosinase
MNARTTFSAEAGRRYLVMVRAYGSHTGSYRFQVLAETIADAAFEPNNTREQATPVSLGAEVRAFLASGDEDWYRAEVPAGGARVIIYTESSIDTFLTVYDANGSRLAEDDDSGEGNNARLTVNLPAGPFYIRVTPYTGTGAGGSQGSYTLVTRIREPAAQDAYEPDNQIQQAKDMEPGQTQIHNFTGAGDVDWVRLRITAAGRYGIRAQGVENPRLDTYIELLNTAEEVIGEDDDGGDSYDSYLSIRLQPGIYYIKVSTLEQEPEGTYRLSVTGEQ